MTYRYNVNAHFEKAETNLKTNDICVAIQEFIDCVEDDIHCDIVDGFTGEVLAIANAPDCDSYATAEMWLMINGYVAELVKIEEEAAICSILGLPS